MLCAGTIGGKQSLFKLESSNNSNWRAATVAGGQYLGLDHPEDAAVKQLQLLVKAWNGF